MIPQSANTMHILSLDFVLVALAAALCAALTMFFNIRAGRSSWSEGPRALGAAFVGWWIGITIFFRSFTADSRMMQWTMWGAALFVVIVGFFVEDALTIKPDAERASADKPGSETTDSRS